MNPVIPFESGEFSIRAVEINGEPWFVGKDVAAALGYADPTTALRSHCRGVQKLHPIPDSLGRPQDTRIINDPDVLRLIVGSSLPAAARFERWVFEDVLPTIRRTGQYGQPRTQAEMLLASAQALVQFERQQQVMAESVARVEHQVQDLRDTMLMSTRPQNAEAISHIRPRMWQKYGIPAHVVDTVLRQLPYSPKPAGMVRNTREEAEGATYAVYWTKDVNVVFARFVGECSRVTPAFVTHPYIEERFRLTPGAEGSAA